MFTTLAFAPLVALYAAQAAYGIVTPTGPGSSDVFKAGSTCLTTWKGDTDSPSPWKTMDIELMSGDNFNMVHVTTVATNQDGSADGQFSFPCPEVDPFSAIYFFQYSTTAVSNKTWTTRFTIASDSGDTTPPANSKQTNGDPIPWGVGKLVDQSQVVPPPPSAGGAVDAGASGSGSASASASATSSSSSVAVAGTTSAATVGQTSVAASSSSSGSSSRFVTSTTGSAGASSTGTSTASAVSANGTSSSQDSSAVVHAAGGLRVAGITAVFAMVFAVLL